jgi:hypothetical protein
MTNAAIRVHAPRAITFTRSKRARRFWRSMDAALREAGLRPTDLAEQKSAQPLMRSPKPFVESKAAA